MGVWVGGHSPTNLSLTSKDVQLNSSFDINAVTESNRGKKVSNEKPTKNWKLGGWKLHGLSRNQMSTPHFIYKNDQVNKINTQGDFENETPTHLGIAHAISKK